VRQFEGVFGYEGSRVESFERAMAERFDGLRVVTPLLNAGDLLLFDGLTFHRTYAHAAMDGHRDALLVRVVRPEHASHFAAGPHWLLEAG
jgi:ectoine hydroxylase-related dioxygenase (phytanoyl-CoA dioxygenase family)